MKTEIAITREYATASAAERIMKAVQPDNRGVPDGTAIQMNVSGTSLLITITSTDPLQSFLRTVDDLLFCIQVAERASAGLK
jgi:tRNA threonylcarbamoyladenosine modification (KEOPS) complex  Pcc1 subunit